MRYHLWRVIGLSLIGMIAMVVGVSCNPSASPAVTTAAVTSPVTPTSTFTPPATSVSIPTVTVTPTEQPTPTRLQDQKSTPHWAEYEESLAESMLAGACPAGAESGCDALCEWVILGHREQEVYVWALCQVAYSDTGPAASGPAVIRLSPGGKIEAVLIPRDGVYYGPDIRKLFPAEVQRKIRNISAYFDSQAAMAHIALRRKNRAIPPMIVEKGTPLP